jgi:phosphoribosyl 1,2-cyclic phosphate phosphodiesterase
MRLTFLGTGTSHGVPTLGCDCPVCRSKDKKNKRTRASLLVETRGRAILIDTTPDFRAQALREGIRRLDAVLYTHAHADHLHGIDDLRPLSYEKSIPIYGGPETLAEIRQRFDYIFRPPKQTGGGIPRLRLSPIQETFFSVLDIPVTAIPLKHGALDILGYRIGAMAYLTDCSRIPASSLNLLEGLEVLIIDALRAAPHPTHFSIDEALSEIRRIRPRRAFLTHFNHDVEHRALKKELPRGAAPSYDGLKLELYILTTLPLFKHRAHTFRVVFVLPTRVFTFMRLGRHTRRRAFLEWLTLLPLTVPFPQISHRLAIILPPCINDG